LTICADLDNMLFLRGGGWPDSYKGWQMQLHRAGLRSVVLFFGMLAAFMCSAAFGANKPIRVLLCTGDWKSQPFYQDLWMAKDGKPDIERGRYIAQQVDAVAPGQFEWTQITNYIGQEYIDADYLSQFDVVLIGDMMGHLSPKLQHGVSTFVKNGGGIIYCANHKYSIFAKPSTQEFRDVFPVAWIMDSVAFHIDEHDVQPIVGEASHPVVAGLDWAGSPTLQGIFPGTVKDKATVLLKTPKGAPILVAWQYGDGRAISSLSIFARDEQSQQFGEWKDFGKYYAQVFTWLAANSKSSKAALHDATGEVTATVDFTKPANAIAPAIFSIHGVEDLGKTPAEKLGLDNFNALNPQGGLYRTGTNIGNTEGAEPDYAKIDAQIADAKRLGLIMLAGFHGITYGEPRWLFKDNPWNKANDKQAGIIADQIALILQHTNNGKKGSPGYAANLQYVELGNEPGLDDNTIAGYEKIVSAVGKRVHADFPGVKVVAYCPYNEKFITKFIDDVGQDFDVLSFHPYGWTPEVLFPFIDTIHDYCVKKGRPDITMIITEWDFWIQGRTKFDYMVKRYFDAVQRPWVTGTIHYRLRQYSEPIYMFGVEWQGYGPPGGPQGPQGSPMHDAYDAFWIWKDFRGQRVDASVSATGETSPKINDFVQAAGAVDGAKLNAVLLYDWAYDGTGFKDYAKGINYNKITVTLKLEIPPATTDRTLTISSANGEGFKVLQQGIKVPANAREISQSIEVEPLTAISVLVQ